MRTTLTAMATVFILAACGQQATVSETPAKPAVTYTVEEVQAETERLNA